MSPRLRARLLFPEDEQADRRGRLVLPLAIIISIMAHIPAVPVLARMSPRSRMPRKVRLEFLMESLARRIEPAVAARSAPVGSSLNAMESTATGALEPLCAAPPVRSEMRLGGMLGLQDKERWAPRVKTAFRPARGNSPAGSKRKWFGWYCKRLRTQIADAYPFELLAKHGVVGEIKFRIEIHPDGRLKRLAVVESDHPMLTTGLEIAMKNATPLPGYRELGLEWFPPLNMTIAH